MTDQQAMTVTVEEHEDEGHSAIGWICVLIMVVGFLIGTVAFVLAIPTAVWVGVGVILVGAILWPILKAAGLGPKGH